MNVLQTPYLRTTRILIQRIVLVVALLIFTTFPVSADDSKLSKFAFCSQISDQEILTACEDCFQAGEDGKSEVVFTAVGCVNVSEKAFASQIVGLLLGVSGGVALLSFLAAAAMFTISQGDTGQVKKAKELMTASVSGILFIIFSVIIMNFIGVNILQIPGLR